MATVSVSVSVTGLDDLIHRMSGIEGALQAWTGLRLRVGTDLVYAPFVHDGTRFMAGRPFLTDAWQAEQPNVTQDLKAGLETVIGGGGVDALRAAFMRAGLRVQATAQRNAPVKTGTLRRSLHTELM